MREIDSTSGYRLDMKRLKRQGKNFDKMRRAPDFLRFQSAIPEHYRDHALKGEWTSCREMHIESDWLLIYRIENDIIFLDRSGSRSELCSQ